MSDNEQGASGKAGAWTEEAKVSEHQVEAALRRPGRLTGNAL